MAHFAHKLIHTAVSISQTHGLASRCLSPNFFIPKIFIPRLSHGANISMAESENLFLKVPSLYSKPWTDYWKTTGETFESQKNWRAATMSYILGSFPTEKTPWKEEIDNLKRESFKKWCQETQAPFEERLIQTPDGFVRYYVCRPRHLSGKIPITIFVNGLEGSAEEFAFPLHNYLHEGTGFAMLSVPGSSDYEAPMTTRSDHLIRFIIDDVEKLSWVDPSKMGMVGFSFGAYWTLIVAKTDPRIKFSLCNGIPLKNSFHVKRSFGLNPIISNALIKMFRLSHPGQLLSVMKELSIRGDQMINRPSGPLLAINGSADSIVDPADTALLGKAKGHKLLWLKNDDHCGLYHYDRMVSIIVMWTKRCLAKLAQNQG